jgi:NADH:ubiquinone oxidoreductase subunit E
VGKYLIQLCRTLSCALVGSENILGHLKQRLGIEIGETTPDGLFTLRTVECLASCGTAPVVQINGAFYEKLTREKIDQILDDLKRGDPPTLKPMGEN